MKRVWTLVVAILAGLIFAAWASDFVPLQGERAVYSVGCLQGTWKAGSCSGQIVAGAATATGPLRRTLKSFSGPLEQTSRPENSPSA